MKTLEKVVNALEEKKCENVLTIETKDRNPFADYIVLASANNERQLEAVAQTLEDILFREEGIQIKRDGKPESGWLVIDAGNLIVHVLTKEKREEFRLEEIA